MGQEGHHVVHLTFDRGTILVNGIAEGFDLTPTPWAVPDGRIGGLLRAPAARYADLVGALAGAGVAVRDEVRAIGPPPSGWNKVDLRPYQEAALSAWTLADRRGLIVLPTGAGKTRVALAAM